MFFKNNIYLNYLEGPRRVFYEIWTRIKNNNMKNKKYHTVRTAPQSKKNKTKKRKMYTASTQIDNRPFSGLVQALQ